MTDNQKHKTLDTINFMISPNKTDFMSMHIYSFMLPFNNNQQLFWLYFGLSLKTEMNTAIVWSLGHVVLGYFQI